MGNDENQDEEGANDGAEGAEAPQKSVKELLDETAPLLLRPQACDTIGANLNVIGTLLHHLEGNLAHCRGSLSREYSGRAIQNLRCIRGFLRDVKKPDQAGPANKRRRQG